jgi:hypothetical protein
MRLIVLSAIAVLGLGALSLRAQDSARTGATAQMPPMGPPEQMKEVAYIVGNWAVTGDIFFDPTSNNPMSFTATASFEWALDSAAIILHYTSSMMGMPYLGMSITTFDREKKQWQEAWVDNMSARMMFMTGQQAGGHRIMEGVDYFMGKELLSRQTSFDMTDTTFSWKFEQSADQGKTWRTLMTASYAKQP